MLFKLFGHGTWNGLSLLYDDCCLNFTHRGNELHVLRSSVLGSNKEPARFYIRGIYMCFVGRVNPCYRPGETLYIPSAPDRALLPLL